MHFERTTLEQLKRAGAPVDAWGELVIGSRADAEVAAIALSAIGGTTIGAAELGALAALHQIQHWLLRNAADGLSLPQDVAPEVRGLVCGSHEESDDRRVAEEALLLVALAENPQASALANVLPDVSSLRQLIGHPECSEGSPGSDPLPSLRLPEDVLRIAFVHREAGPSLEGQIDHLLQQFASTLALSPDYKTWLDLRFRLSEESRWHARHDAHGPGASAALRFEGDAAHPVAAQDERRFSADRSWMPRVVLLAKSVYVWLAQLSAECGRTLTTLSDIPDEVLDSITSRGFTALWLIGIWRRSPASATIKKRQGTSDAIASAYSIDSYEIDDRLGGQAAYENLRERLHARGIRLAADLVPNHMGVDSEWVRKHPDYFVQTATCPYEAYRFSVDVSSDPDVGTFLEDGYWNRSDAAVVFKRVDRHSGQESFIYHGNDGTSMPWNDTAQLDYTNPSVRAAMLDLIVHVAKMFPILRFDAAMTLAKQHYQRLWFPQHGGGEAIASRGRFAMSQAEFDRAMPREFWSEVVEAVATRAPDTLLLAEAFWMMEGYFVRSLGMHRVYNSAFMNMFKAEENAKYHELIRNVVEYDPEILGRFVNFMNNPDEEPAAVQFGTTDKYFAVCTLLATLPGTPMFGHGQFEGLREKYGMEFYRPMQDETVDRPLLAAHEAKIVPLLRRRFVFAQARSFRLFPLQTDHGQNPNVFAYCNAHGDEVALVLVHNRYEAARGRLSQSVPFRGDDGSLVEESLVDVLFRGSERVTLVHATTGHEWPLERETVQREGLFVELGPYAHDVWWVMRVSAQPGAGDQRADADATIASNRESAFSSVAIEGPNEKRT